MRWEDERYVRLYTRDTIDWTMLSFEAQGLLALILRKVDRAGLLHLGKHGKRGVAAAVGHPSRWATIEPALDELLADGCIVIRGEHLIFRNFVEAQECNASDGARQRAKRERDRDLAMAREVLGGDVTENVSPVTNSPPLVTQRDSPSRNVTNPGGAVTSCDEPPSKTPTPVTPSRAVPCRAEPAVPGDRARAIPSPAGLSLWERLTAEYERRRGGRYKPTRRDHDALRSILAHESDEERIFAVWCVALGFEKYPKCNCVRDLDEHWNTYAVAADVKPSGVGDDELPPGWREYDGTKDLYEPEAPRG